MADLLDQLLAGKSPASLGLEKKNGFRTAVVSKGKIHTVTPNCSKSFLRVTPEKREPKALAVAQIWRRSTCKCCGAVLEVLLQESLKYKIRNGTQFTTIKAENKEQQEQAAELFTQNKIEHEYCDETVLQCSSCPK